MSGSASLPLVAYPDLAGQVEALERDGYAYLPGVLSAAEIAWHKGTPNRSAQTRYLLQVHYSKMMITQRYPPYLGRFQFDERLLDKATPRQRRLLGDHPSGAYA
jgi:hypothetical protein